MSKKWLLTLTGSLLAAIIVTGCADDQDPAPPGDTIEENPTEDNGGTEEGTNGGLMDDEGTEEGTDGGLMDDEGTEEGTNGGTNEGTEEGAGTDGTEGAENGTTEDENKDK
ncbi:MAG: hypothetical protein ACQEWV_09710 [Bacillota bacterium]